MQRRWSCRLAVRRTDFRQRRDSRLVGWSKRDCHLPLCTRCRRNVCPIGTDPVELSVVRQRTNCDTPRQPDPESANCPAAATVRKHRLTVAGRLRRPPAVCPERVQHLYPLLFVRIRDEAVNLQLANDGRYRKRAEHAENDSTHSFKKCFH